MTGMVPVSRTSWLLRMTYLNGLGMLFMKLLTNRAQMFADVRTYWSPEAVKKATGYDLEGVAKESGGFIHLINSGACCLDASGEAKDENGNGVMKAMVECNRGRPEGYPGCYYLERS